LNAEKSVGGHVKITELNFIWQLDVAGFSK